MAKRYIADLHFFDEDVRERMDRRPFASCREMEEYIVDRWNGSVHGTDEVIILGDMFSKQGTPTKEVNRVLQELNGRLFLITGNHDGAWLGRKGVELDRFEWIAEQKTVKDVGRMVLLNHYPILFFGRNHVRDRKGRLLAYMLHGHVHGSMEAEMLYRFQREAAGTSFRTAGGSTEPMVCNCINCFCAYSDYRPLTLSEWEELRSRNYGRK